MSLDALFAEIAAQDWRVTNLYQSDRGVWRVCLHYRVEGGAEYGDWAEAESLEDALYEAMAKMTDREFAADPEQSYSIDTTPKPSLLAALGLAKPKVTINRRV